VLNVLIERTPEQVWDVLSDGRTYAEWVAGTQHIRDVDAGWPEPGARIHFTVGIGRWGIDDVSTVRLMEPCRRLELEAHAGRLGSARVSIELLAWGEGRTVVIIDEHPLTGPGARWHSVPLDAALRVRNRRMMRSLARVVSERHPTESALRG
jgi:carbon monoxide dehydrogenase subunit G